MLWRDSYAVSADSDPHTPIASHRTDLALYLKAFTLTFALYTDMCCAVAMAKSQASWTPVSTYVGSALLFYTPEGLHSYWWIMWNVPCK